MASGNNLWFTRPVTGTGTPHTYSVVTYKNRSPLTSPPTQPLGLTRELTLQSSQLSLHLLIFPLREQYGKCYRKMANSIFFLSIAPGLAMTTTKCLRTMRNRVRSGKLSIQNTEGIPFRARMSRLLESSQLRIPLPDQAQPHGHPAWRRILLQFGEVGPEPVDVLV